MKHIYGMKKNRFAFTPLETLKRKPKFLTGFTLLELLIAVTIFSITALALYSSFHAGMRILRRAQEVMKSHQDLRLAMNELSLDLRNSLLCPIHKEEKEKPAVEEEEEEPVYFFFGEGKKFTFVTLRDVYVSAGRLKSQICNVTYYLDGTETKRLIRIIKYQGRGFVTRPGEEEGLLADIEDMEVQYSYKGEEEDSPPLWLNSWEQEEEVPLGVKIKFRLKGLGTLRDFTKTVFIPVGALGVLEEDQEL